LYPPPGVSKAGPSGVGSLLTNLVQQARRLADRTAFFLTGQCVEIGETEDLFNGKVKDDRTSDYIQGRFG
jgi:phosphate transport system ATP-binding protein